MKKKICIVKKPVVEKIYRFNPVGDRDGQPSPYHHEYHDQQDFVVNENLLQQIGWENCQEKTPEGRALWLYMRLCQLFKYDEGIFFSDHRQHPNDDPYKSFAIAGQTTAETPTTCFNFSRIAVKLLNQIEGVHALMITVGSNDGHFRFGYYTDKVTVDAEPTSPKHHYNDMARVKLGIAPQGLNVLYGQDLMQELEKRIVPKMLPHLTPDLEEELAWLRDEKQLPPVEQVKIKPLIDHLRQNNIDGATTLQVLFDLNRRYEKPPYKLLRAGFVRGENKIDPQLLLRKDNRLARIDLASVELSNLPVPVFDMGFTYGDIVYANDEIEQYLDFSCSLAAEDVRQR